MERHRLSSTELIATAGGLLLVISLFLPWYHGSTNRANIDGESGTFSCWHVHPILRWLLLLAGLAPFILAYIIVREHQLSWPRGELTAVVAIAASASCSTTRSSPAPATRTAPSTCDWGWFIALLGILLMLFGSAMRRRRPSASASPRGSSEPMDANRPDRNLALELVRMTEAAALAAARLVGMGDKEAADQAAVDAMRLVLDTVHMDGVVVIGEGEKDEAPMLYNGEHIGDGSPPEADIAVDPLEGTTLTAKGMPSALAVIALPERGRCSTPGPASTWRSSPAAADIADLLDLDRPLGRPSWARRRAARRGRPRHDGRRARPPAPRGGHRRDPRRGRARAPDLRRRRQRRAAGGQRPLAGRRCCGASAARPRASSRPRRSSASGGGLVGRLWPRDDDERRAAIDAGYDLDRQLTPGRARHGRRLLLLGDRRDRRGRAAGRALPGARAATTESIVMRSRTGTVRRITATHNREKLRAYAAERFG